MTEPTDTPKHARDMTPEERKAKLDELRRGPKPDPVMPEKHARDMSDSEKSQWWAEHRRRWQ
jgi:hypothetical protein